MSDEQFMKQVEEVEDENERLVSERKKQRKRKMAGLDELDDSMDDVVLQVKKKRTEPELEAKMRSILDKIMEMKDEEGNDLTEPFVKLPSRKELPDYYTVITKPMDFERIEKKIETGRYTTMEELNTDMLLLVNNAQKFNEEDSAIYQDSQKIEAMWKKEYSNLMDPPKAPEVKKEIVKEAPAPSSQPSTSGTSSQSDQRARQAAEAQRLQQAAQQQQLLHALAAMTPAQQQQFLAAQMAMGGAGTRANPLLQMQMQMQMQMQLAALMQGGGAAMAAMAGAGAGAQPPQAAPKESKEVKKESDVAGSSTSTAKKESPEQGAPPAKKKKEEEPEDDEDDEEEEEVIGRRRVSYPRSQRRDCGIQGS